MRSTAHRIPFASALALLAALPLAACAAAESAPAPTPTASSTSPATGGVTAPRCPAVTVPVDDARSLRDALDAARPGDVIGLADGRYPGRFDLTAAGTDTQPIWLCGGPDAVLDGGGTDHGTVLHLSGASHWRLVGFTVQNGQKGIMADRTTDTVFGALTVRRIGDEAIHLRDASSGNLVVESTVSQTGLRRVEFGEGVYVGTARSNWCSISGCDPDRSDDNRIVGNDITATTAEAVDIKEGTTAGLVSGNRFDGSELTGDADSWVDVKGNDWLITGNTGEHSPGDGFQTHEIVTGWGTGNRFTDNVARVDGPGFGFALTPALGNRVDCSNAATGAARGLANVDCVN